MITLDDKEYDKLVKMADYQLPQKPDLYSDGYADGNEVWEAFCPKCGKEVDDYNDFCPACGQRIDWSDGEEE